MKFRLATWNINSVRLRLALVERFVAAYRPDILCLQEIKCATEAFPYDRLSALGFPHIEVNGQPGYHGVATLSRLPLIRVGCESFCDTGEARHLATDVTASPTIVRLHNVYIPSGGDVPDGSVNDKFRLKLAHMRAMAAWFAGEANDGADLPMILAGDFNVAPLENDVWSHKQLIDVVSHTPVEVAHLADLQASRGWVDVVRRQVPEDRKLYTWWSYRARDWRASNRGRRLDHIWVTPPLAGAAAAIQVVDEARDWPKPSDHVPVITDFDIS